MEGDRRAFDQDGGMLEKGWVRQLDLGSASSVLQQEGLDQDGFCSLSWPRRKKGAGTQIAQNHRVVLVPCMVLKLRRLHAVNVLLV